jgi:hypothetical protein
LTKPKKGPAPDQLEPGETVLALACCSPPGAIERQAGQPMRLALTDRRFLVLKTSRMTGRTKGEIELEVPLRDVVSVQIAKRHPIATLGVLIFSVAVVRSDGKALVCETSGFGIKGLWQLAEILEKTARTVPESKYGSSAEASDTK